MPRGKTQKRRSKTKKVLTIPELRQSLDYITDYTDDLIKSAKTTKEAAQIFASEWKRVFGKVLPMATAESYINHIKNMKKPSKKGKHTRKLRGGNAPIGYMTRPGTDLPYGNFLSYVSKGFTNPEPALQYDNERPLGVLPYPETGSNRMNGGGLYSSIMNTFSAAASRPFVAQNPPSVQQDAQTAWKGQSLGPGSASYERAYQYQMPASGSMGVAVSPVYTRVLNNDVSTR